MRNISPLVTAAVLFLLIGCGSSSQTPISEPIEPIPIQSATPPKDISNKMDHFTSFAELYNLIRYYYPGDEAASIDWEAFALLGFRRIDNASSSETIEELLIELFKSIAPSLIINGQVIGTEQPATPSAYTFWHHYGFGFGYRWNGNLTGYQNERVQTHSATDSKYFPSPIYHRQRLASGLEISFPLAIATENNNTVPSAVGFMVDESQQRLNRNFNDLYVRLSSAAITWGVFQHFFPYKNEMNLQWESRLPNILAESATATNIEDQIKLLKKLTAHLEDAHVFYFYDPASSAKGVSPFVVDWIENQAVVTDVWGNAIGKISRGYVLTHIGGETVESLLAKQELLISMGADKRRASAVYDLTLIETATKSYQFIDNLGVPFEVSFAPDNHYDRHFNDSLVIEKPAAILSELDNGILYFNLVDWQESDVSLVEVQSTLVNADKIIIDWRGYPIANEVWDLIGYLCETQVDSPPFITKNAQQPNMNEAINSISGWSIYPQPRNTPTSVAVIIGRNTQSAADTGAALFESCPNATLIGESTTGANGNITGFDLFGGQNKSGLQITFSGLQVLQNDNSRLIGIGVKPDIPVTFTRQGIIDQVDQSLQKAVEFLE